MRKEVDAEFLPLQKEIFERTREIEVSRSVGAIYQRKENSFSPNLQFIGHQVVKRAWKLATYCGLVTTKNFNSYETYPTKKVLLNISKIPLLLEQVSTCSLGLYVTKILPKSMKVLLV
jgi:hypothetical protein